MMARRTSSIPRRDSPELCKILHPSKNRGRVLPQEGSRECRTLGASAAACALVESTRVSHHGHAGNVRHSPRNGFNGCFALSPVTGLVCHRRRRDAKHHRRLDASVGASGPHDFAVRDRPSSPKGFAGLCSSPPKLQRRRIGGSSTRMKARDDASRPPHPIPRFVTIASRPSFGTGCAE